jgi:succinate dehydrogenase cytochrome b556 subunit
MSTLRATLEGGLRYRGREGQISFFLHRISGLGTLLFLAIHILDTSTVYFFPDLYQHAIELYRKTGFMLGEMLLVGGVIYHGVNGLRIAIFDLFPQLWREKTQKLSFYVVMGLSVLLGGPAVFLMGRALYLNNICQCAPVEEMSLVLPTWADAAIFGFLAVAMLGVVRIGSFLTPSGAVKRNYETWMWLFMRWSAILLIPLVWVHVLLVDVIFGVHRIDLDFVALRWATVGWRAYDVALLAFAFAHGTNGFRTVLRDYLHSDRARKNIDRVLPLLWAVITAIGAVAVIGGARVP